MRLCEDCMCEVSPFCHCRLLIFYTGRFHAGRLSPCTMSTLTAAMFSSRRGTSVDRQPSCTAGMLAAATAPLSAYNLHEQLQQIFTREAFGRVRFPAHCERRDQRGLPVGGGGERRLSAECHSTADRYENASRGSQRCTFLCRMRSTKTRELSRENLKISLHW